MQRLGEGELVFGGDRDSVLQDEIVLEMGGGDGYALRLYLKHEHLKTVNP